MEHLKLSLFALFANLCVCWLELALGAEDFHGFLLYTIYSINGMFLQSRLSFDVNVYSI